MANTIRIKRGLKADIENLTLLPGELGVTLDTQELYVGDKDGNKQLIKGAAAGVVESAEKLSTARNISLSGDATGSVAFDGSKDVTIAMTLANSGVAAGTYNNVTVNEKGLVTSASNKTYTIEDITGLQGALNSKANSIDVYTKEETYTKEEVNTAIKNAEVDAYTKSEMDTKLAAKANSADLGTLASKSSVTKTELGTELKAEIEGKANTADLGALATKNEVAEADLASALATKINDKAEASTVSTLSETVEGHTTSISTINQTLSTKANSADVYTSKEVDDKLAAKADSSSVYTKTQTDSLLEGKADKASLGSLAGKSSIAKTDLASALVTELDAKATTATLNSELAKKADVSTVTTLSQTVDGKADAATTLAGYGIKDAYTKEEVDGKIAGTFKFVGEKNSLEELNALTGMKAGDVYQVGDKEYAYDGDSWVELGFNIDLSAYAKSADVADTYATIAEMNKKANSADVYTKAEVNTELSKKAAASDLTALTNRVGTAEGEIDTLQEEIAKKANSATTLAGYGITNAYTKSEADETFMTEAEVTAKGYATTSALNNGLAAKADSASVYTKTEIDNKKFLTAIPDEYITETELETELSSYATKGTTLSHYGITNALAIDSVIDGGTF